MNQDRDADQAVRALPVAAADLVHDPGEGPGQEAERPGDGGPGLVKVGTHPAGSDWWGRDSAAIEQATLAARAHGVRTVLLRTGCVLTPGSLAQQVVQFRPHFAGWIGTGCGWTPWIHIADEVGIILSAVNPAPGSP